MLPALLVLLTLHGTCAAVEVFRADLFPEQLQQQQIQFNQINLQRQLQDIQRLIQVANPAEQRRLLEQQQDIHSQIRFMQQQLLNLQDSIQQKLGGKVTVIEVPSEGDVQVRILNRLDNPPVPQNPATEPSGFRPQQFNRPPTSQFTGAVNQESTASTQQFNQSPDEVNPQQPSTEAIIPCSTLTGEAGFCRPLIKCLSFYAELPELKKQPCQLGQGGLGVCCPRRTRIEGGPIKNNGVLRPPVPPEVVIPPFTPQQLNHAAESALQKIKDRINFITGIFNNGVTVKPGSAAASHQEFFPVSNNTLNEGETAQKNVEASVDLVNEFNLSPDQGKFALPTFSVLNTVIADTCSQPSRCRPSKYRSADGSCNNLQQGQWGRSGVALQRILPPKYDDGVNAPRRLTSTGQELSSARLISTRVAQDSDNPSNNYTLMVMQWGQFLDHDLTHTPINFGRAGIGISCCRDGEPLDQNLRHPDCFHIDVPKTDKIFSPFGERCMEFVRSLPAPRPECNFGPREQMNQITGYLDGSNIYGSSLEAQRGLREFRGGRLRIQNFGGKRMLPANVNECRSADQRMSCFLAGDGRVNEQINLAVMHTVWMREHNRVATELAQLHPEWSDEALFQESRRIVVAEIQHITYNEWLPIVLGRAYMDKFQLSPKESGWSKVYDPEINGGITNVFATAAFRFGHSLIQGHMFGYGRFGNVKENIQLSKNHFSPFLLYKDGAVDNMIRGLASQSSQKFDRFFTKEITDHLFQGDLDLGLDLVALNIQRGRDHGLPPYNEWRNICGMKIAMSWQDLLDVMDGQSINHLASVYPSVDEIDLFMGAVSEKPLEGAILGPTFTCLVGDQFSRLKRGDRYFYEESSQMSTFSSDQLEQLRKTSLARILCDNSDNITLIQPLAFVQPSFLNQRVACTSLAIPKVQLKPWIQERAAVN